MLIILSIILLYILKLFIITFLDGYFKWGLLEELELMIFILPVFWPLLLAILFICKLHNLLKTFSPLNKINSLGRYYSNKKLKRLFYNKEQL